MKQFPCWMSRAGRALSLAALTALVAGAVVAAPDSAATPVPVVIGGTSCFQIRCAQGEMSAAERANHIQDVFAKYLGASTGSFTTRRGGSRTAPRIDILLNGDMVVRVTSADARATRYQRADEVAPIWKKALEKAFEETHVRTESQHR